MHIRLKTDGICAVVRPSKGHDAYLVLLVRNIKEYGLHQAVRDELASKLRIGRRWGAESYLGRSTVERALRYKKEFEL